MNNKDLENVAIIGLGLLGGSLGLALQRAFPKVKRYGYSHREVTRNRAYENGTVDVCCDTLEQVVSEADFIILASPIGTFEDILKVIAPHVKKGALVTDVGSTKVDPVRWGRKYLPKYAEFLGSHPMAGSEQRGVDFAKADLFEGAHCILTPTKSNKDESLEFLKEFWSAIGMVVGPVMTPRKHDNVVAMISHLPHVLAMSMVNISDSEDILLCGKGFLDTTRIASGPSSIWRDILMANSANTEKAVGKLIKELTRVQKVLRDENDKAIVKKLDQARIKRDELVKRKLQRKELPS